MSHETISTLHESNLNLTSNALIILTNCFLCVIILTEKGKPGASQGRKARSLLNGKHGGAIPTGFIPRH